MAKYTYLLTFDSKPRLRSFIFFRSAFFSKTSYQNFLFTNLTIVFGGLALPSLWQPSISLFRTVIFRHLKISITFFSRALPETDDGIPWISMLFLLFYWSSLFRYSLFYESYSSKIWNFFCMLRSYFLTASMNESLTFIIHSQWLDPI